MNWKTFFMILLLILITCGMLYFMVPKYYFHVTDTTEIPLIRGNKITGNVEWYVINQKEGWAKWVMIKDKKLNIAR